MTENANYENKEESIPVENGNRFLRVKLNYNKTIDAKQPLIIMATGYASHMDKPSQRDISWLYQKAGFATLQFNFMGHGIEHNQSDGSIEDTTLSSGITDLKTVYYFAKTNKFPDVIDTTHIAINANSYGALVALRALEQKTIQPQSMILVAPYTLERIRPWILPLNLLMKLIPNRIAKKLPPPFTKKMITDFSTYHCCALQTANLLSSTAVHFFVGTQDALSSYKELDKMIRNAQPYITLSPERQSRLITYENVKHFNMPKEIQLDINRRAIEFIRKTRENCRD